MPDGHWLFGEELCPQAFQVTANLWGCLQPSQSTVSSKQGGPLSDLQNSGSKLPSLPVHPTYPSQCQASVHGALYY